MYSYSCLPWMKKIFSVCVFCAMNWKYERKLIWFSHTHIYDNHRCYGLRFSEYHITLSKQKYFLLFRKMSSLLTQTGWMICLLATRHFPLRTHITQSLMLLVIAKLERVHLLYIVNSMYRESPIIGPGEVNNVVHCLVICTLYLVDI